MDGSGNTCIISQRLENKEVEEYVSKGLIKDLLPWCDIIAKSFIRKHYYNNEIELEDYKNSAVIGLHDALRNYDDLKGALKPYCFKYMYYEMNRLLMNSNAYQLKRMSISAEGDDMLNNYHQSEALVARIDGIQEKNALDDIFTDCISLEKLLSELSLDKKKVILEHYFKSKPLKDVALSMGRTPSRISQIHNSALKELNEKIT